MMVSFSVAALLSVALFGLPELGDATRGSCISADGTVNESLCKGIIQRTSAIPSCVSPARYDPATKKCIDDIEIFTFCPNGAEEREDGACELTTRGSLESRCPFGLHLLHDMCLGEIHEELGCPQGTEDAGAYCIDKRPIDVVANCREGFHKTGTKCVLLRTLPPFETCHPRYHQIGSRCVELIGEGWHCPLDSIADSEGTCLATVMMNHKCDHHGAEFKYSNEPNGPMCVKTNKYTVLYECEPMDEQKSGECVTTLGIKYPMFKNCEKGTYNGNEELPECIERILLPTRRACPSKSRNVGGVCYERRSKQCLEADCKRHLSSPIMICPDGYKLEVHYSLETFLQNYDGRKVEPAKSLPAKCVAVEEEPTRDFCTTGSIVDGRCVEWFPKSCKSDGCAIRYRRAPEKVCPRGFTPERAIASNMASERICVVKGIVDHSHTCKAGYKPILDQRPPCRRTVDPNYTCRDNRATRVRDMCIVELEQPVDGRR